jgi:NAD+ diphosphatase
MRPHNFYAAPGFERAGLRRKDPSWIGAQLVDPGTLFVPVWRSQSLVLEFADSGPRAILLAAADLAPLLGERVAALEDEVAQGLVAFLGIIDGRSHFALDLSPIEDPLERLGGLEAAASGLRFADLRQIGAVLDRSDGSLLAFARAMMFWHSRHRFCGVCGAPARCEEGGHVRRCTACNTLHFPRTDPAVIMLAVAGDRALLGRQRQFPRGMYSTLAGFVEPGESLEDAVAREVREETAIEVDRVIYHSSQPWPFPGSIMLGFHARAVTADIVIDPGEIEQADWFERGWILAHEEDNEFRLPRRDSIARRLIEDWLHGGVEI